MAVIRVEEVVGAGVEGILVDMVAAEHKTALYNAVYMIDQSILVVN